MTTGTARTAGSLGLDPELLQAAAHEIGHALVDVACGIPVLGIEVDRRSNTGMTRTGFDDRNATRDQLWGALIGGVAGFEAELLWCQRHSGHADPINARTDYANFDRNRHRVGLSKSVARAQARTILIQRWPRLERLALRLAQYGQLDPTTL